MGIFVCGGGFGGGGDGDLVWWFLPEYVYIDNPYQVVVVLDNYSRVYLQLWKPPARKNYPHK